MEVKTAVRALAVFEAFARARKPLTLAELSRLIQSPPSSCLYIVRTLEAAGYMYPAGARKAFYPTRKLLEIATVIAEAEPWLDEIIPLLETLRDETRETIILGKLQGKRIIYLDVREGPQTIRYSAQAGDTRPLHSTSIGKALLSTMPPAKQTRLLNTLELPRVTDTTITDKVAFIAELEDTARRGYAVTRGESVRDVLAIAKPVSLITETYAVAVAGPIERMTSQFEENLARLEATCAAMVEARGARRSGRPLE